MRVWLDDNTLPRTVDARKEANTLGYIVRTDACKIISKMLWHTFSCSLAWRTCRSRGVFTPLPLTTKILRGIRDTHEAEHPEDAGPEAEMQRGMARAALLHDEPPSLVATLHENDRQHKSTPRRTTFRLADGKNKRIDLTPTVP